MDLSRTPSDLPHSDTETPISHSAAQDIESDTRKKQVLSESMVLEEEFEAIHGVICPDLPEPEWPVAGGTHAPDKRSASPLSNPNPESPKEDARHEPTNEAKRLTALHEATHNLTQPRTALCLSGGGIRSATFCLGVLQALARPPAPEDQQELVQGSQLERFHYLSTVSGGGYIGSWLSAWMSRAGLGSVMAELGRSPTAPGSTPSAPEAEPIKHLRAYSNYLAPRRGWSADSWSLVVLYVRNLLLNWLVLWPLLFAVFLLPRINASLLQVTSISKWHGIDPILVSAGGIVLATCVSLVAICLPSAGTWRLKSRSLQRSCPWLLCLAAWLLTWAWIQRSTQSAPTIAIPFSLYLSIAVHTPTICALLHRAVTSLNNSSSAASWTNIKDRLLDFVGLLVSLLATAVMMWLGVTVVLPAMGTNHLLLATFAVPYALMSYLIVGTVWIGATALWTTEADREWWATSSGGAVALAVAWIGLHALVFYAPGTVLRLGSVGAVALAGVGGLSGIATALGGYWGRRRAGEGVASGKRLRDLLAKWGLQAGALIFLVLFLGIGGSLLVAAGLDWKWKEYRTGLQDVSAAKIAIDKYLEARNSVDELLNSAYVKLKREAAERRQHAAWEELTEDPELKELTGGTELRQEASEELRRAARKELAGADSWLGKHLREIDRHLRVRADVYRNGLIGPPGGSRPPLWVLVSVLVVLVPGAVLVSTLIGVNRFSLHSIYANRLVRAYLGASRPKEDRERDQDPLTGFDDGDNVPMAKLPGGQDGEQKAGSVRLLHVLGTALNLVGGARLEWQQRKASSFTISPLHAGSWTLGYRPVKEYGGDKGITLGKAMGISGAAVSPNMGYHSSILVATVMTFFNARLGWWLPNPGKKGEGVWRKKEPRVGCVPLVKEGLGMTTEQEAFVNLSDGGHFDNLGLYEMVRRRCRRILIVDASADPDYHYEDLANTIRKIRTDIGVRLEFPKTSGPVRQRPPRGAYTIGWIRYSDVDGAGVSDGVLVYVKPVLTGGEPVDVERYAAEHCQDGDRFPHQSTADQFFDEAQFESYRMLGKHMATRVMQEVTALETFRRASPDAVIAMEAAAPGVVPLAAEVGRGVSSGEGPASTIGDTIGRATRPGMVASALGAAQSWGTVTLLGTALTVGGILGVSGTVALRPTGEVQGHLTLKEPLPGIGLSDEAKKRLSEGIPVNVNVKVTPNLDTQLTSRVEDLTKAVGQLAGALGPGTSKDPELTGRVRGLAEAVGQLTKMLPGRLDATKVDEIDRRLKQMESNLLTIRNLISDEVSRAVGEKIGGRGNLFDKFDEIKNAVVGVASAVGSVKTAVDELKTSVGAELKSVKHEVESVGPRRNIRGGREGAR